MKNQQLILLALLSTSILFVANQPARAGSATWNLNPTSGDWNTATNWMPNTVPNGATDVATFGVSNTTGVSLSASVTLDSIVFNPGASAYTVTTGSGGITNALTISGSGIVNNSGSEQNFVAPMSGGTGLIFTGSGIVSGPVTVGTGAFLAPAHGSKTQTTLTIQSPLTLNSNSTYTCTFKAKGNKAKTDNVIANGVTIDSGASFNLSGATKGTLTRGLTLTVISNTSANPIAGTFSNLADGAILTVGANHFQASYEGGDGNDLTLTVIL
ncbi:MAG: hypothetical protein ACREIF_05200 [Chthoniobacterales bacterium]